MLTASAARSFLSLTLLHTNVDGLDRQSHLGFAHVLRAPRSRGGFRPNPRDFVHVSEMLIEREEVRSRLHRVRRDPYVVGRQRRTLPPKSSGNAAEAIGS